jgi:hypothetical protein
MIPGQKFKKKSGILIFLFHRTLITNYYSHSVGPPRRFRLPLVAAARRIRSIVADAY